jgi:hypothetical protein
VDLATVDKLLTATRTVRKCLALTRAVEPEILQTYWNGWGHTR